MKNPSGGRRTVLVAALALTVSMVATATGASTAGDEAWSARHPGGNSPLAGGRVVATSPDGSRVYVTGGSDQGYATLAYDAFTGDQLWSATYRDGAYSTSLALSPDGTRVHVSGEQTSAYRTVAYDAMTGRLLWSASYEGSGGWASGTSLGVSPDGSKVYIAGTHPGTASRDYVAVAYDATTGHQLWAASYNGPGDAQDNAASMAINPDGGAIYITGTSGVGNSADYATVAFDGNDGERIWATRYDGPGNAEDFAVSTVADPTGAVVYVTGSSVGSGSSLDYATAAYDAITGREI